VDTFFSPAAAARPGLSGFSLLSEARETFIMRLALADLAERYFDLQYYIGTAIRLAGSLSTA
jgi:putative cardiolipin synthase